MTGREQELLEALGGYDRFMSVPLLQHNHPGLRQYSTHQLFFSAGVLFRAGLINRTITNPEREARYRITGEGLVMIESLADPASAQQSQSKRGTGSQ